MPSLPFEDENLPLFTVGQVSTMLEIQQAFLRRLDEFGVVQPSRSSGGQRRYTRNEITVVQYVVRLADEGMTLPVDPPGPGAGAADQGAGGGVRRAPRGAAGSPAASPRGGEPPP